MMLPSIFTESLFDDLNPTALEHEFFGKNPLYGKREKNMMKTDVKETENSFEIDMDLPGFKKDQIGIKLENGYLLVSAAKSLEKTNDEKEKSYIRRERWSGSCSRSFYVGEGVKAEDIKAKMEDGILHMSVPKKEKALPTSSQVLIEG